MAYIVFATKEDAEAAERQAVANVRAFAESYVPERLADDNSLICFNAATKQLDPSAERTRRWAVPQQYVEGWAFPVPSASEIAPMPVDLFMIGVDGLIVDDITPLPADEAYDHH